jgi:hypothetical protein
VVVPHYKKDYLLNCLTNSSDISGYHVDFYEGHGTVGARQGRGMEWERHGRGMDTACYLRIGLYYGRMNDLHGIESILRSG